MLHESNYWGGAGKRSFCMGANVKVGPAILLELQVLSRAQISAEGNNIFRRGKIGISPNLGALKDESENKGCMFWDCFS